MAKEYEVGFEGTITIEADSDAEATDQAYELLHEATIGLFSITSSEEIL